LGQAQGVLVVSAHLGIRNDEMDLLAERQRQFSRREAIVGMKHGVTIFAERRDDVLDDLPVLVGNEDAPATRKVA